MVLVPYKRRWGLRSVRDEMDDLFNRFFERSDLGGCETGGWIPALDVAECDDAFLVEAELPGMEPDDIEISVHDSTLTISGQKKEQREENGENYFHVERRYGSFHRSVPLPGTVDTEKIQATHANGVLKITLPKSEAARPRKIKVKTE